MEYDRSLAIAELVSCMVDEIDQGELSLYALIENGFIGIENMTDDQIMQELEDRDVSYLFGENDE